MATTNASASDCGAGNEAAKPIPIKFRGWSQEICRWFNSDDHEFLFSGGEVFAFDSYGDRYRIDPDNLTQLVGYDDDGEEIYINNYVRIVSKDGEPHPIYDKLPDVEIKDWATMDKLRKENRRDYFPWMYSDAKVVLVRR